MPDERTTAQPSVMKETHDLAAQLARELSAAVGANVEIRRVYQVAICVLDRRLRGRKGSALVQQWGRVITENGLGE
jgi:hypothetical protein